MLGFLLHLLLIVVGQSAHLSLIAAESLGHVLRLLGEVTGIHRHLLHLLDKLRMCFDISLLLLLAHLLELLQIHRVDIASQNLRHHLILDGLLL